MQDDLQTLLSQEEQDWLDDLIANRVSEEEAEAETPESDVGVLSFGELDGFLTAMISGPHAIKPSEWWPAIWGDYPPRWQDQQEMTRVFGLIVRHMNGIIDTLVDDPETFEPMFGEREFEGETVTVFDEWCAGYMLGVQLAMAEWQKGGETVTVNLAPIMMFGTEKGWERLKTLADNEYDALSASIPEAVRTLHAFWLKQRGADSEPVMREAPKVGRNDPCPCGSGMKYKKCCLH